MPKRKDIKKILIIGSGPIVIGQACEFDYSGAQACKVLRQEGYKVVLVNSNPATIMTDPELADRTYIEPITPEIVEKIIAQRTAGQFTADAGRADGTEYGRGAGRKRCAEKVQGPDCWGPISNPSNGPRNATGSRRSFRISGWKCPRAAMPIPGRGPGRSSRRSVFRRSSGRPIRSAAWAAMSPTTWRSTKSTSSGA